MRLHLTFAFCFAATITSWGCEQDVRSTHDDCQSLSACVPDVNAAPAPVIDGSLTTSDGGMQDSTLGLTDMGKPDASADADVTLPDAWVAPCDPAVGEVTETSDWVIDQQISSKTPSSLGRIAAINLAGDGPDSMQFFVVTEGRLFRRDAAGELRWQTGLLGLNTINAVDDIEGDGDLEVIASGDSMIAVLDALTGTLLWSLPIDAFGSSTFSAIARLMIVDLTGDGLKDIYVTNGGCGGGGDGKGLIFSYQDEQFVMVQQLFGNRLNGKCGAWQTVFDTDGDQQAEVLITDGNGLNAFDISSGQKTVCGTESAPPNGPFPTQLIETSTGPRWLVFIEDTAHQMVIQADPTCEGGHAFVSVWQFELGTNLSSDGAGFRLGDSALPTHFIFNAENSTLYEGIVSVNLETGASTQISATEKLLGVLSRSEFDGQFLVTKAALATGMSAINIYELTGERWEILSRIESANGVLITEQASLTATKEFRLPMVVRSQTDNLPRFLISETGDDDDLRTLYLVSPNGARRSLVEDEFSGDIRPFCNHVAPCMSADTSTFLVTTSGGDVLSIDLNNVSAPRHHFSAFSGTDQLITINGEPGYLGVLSARGRLTAHRNTLRGFERLWSVSVGSPRNRGPFGLGASINGQPVFVIRDPRTSQAAWSAFDGATGAHLWHHALREDEAFVFNAPVMVGGSDPVFLRLDYAQDNLMPQDPSCPALAAPLEENFFTPHPNCPNKAVRARVITALDPLTGACQWRRVFKAVYPLNEPGITYGCPGPVNQRLSIDQNHHDQSATAFVTEAMTLRSFRTDRGPTADDLAGFEHTFLFGKTFEDVNIGGGQVTLSHSNETLLLHGGPTPPMKFDTTLNRIWSADNISPIRTQNWLLQDAVEFGDKIWTSASSGYPLITMDNATGARAQYWALVDGQAQRVEQFNPIYPAIKKLKLLQHQDVTQLAVTTDEGFIYFFDATGEFMDSLKPATPVFNLITLNYSNQKQLLYSTGGGRVAVIKPAILNNPTIVFDVDCPPISTCDPSRDIEQTSDLNQLCFAWIPVQGAIGYEVAVQTTNGLKLNTWQAVGIQPVARVDRLSLIPGQTYFGSIRALFENEGIVERSNAVLSNGVEVQRSDVPTATLRVSINSQPPILTIEASARDDDLLTRWRLDLIESETGQVLQRVGSGPLAVTEWSESFTVGLETLQAAIPNLETITIEFNVGDRSGQGYTERAQIALP
jgi:hypothetical protein